MTVERKLTAAQFWNYLQQHDHGDRIVELINGAIVEMPANLYSSALAARLIILIGLFVQQHGLGFVTGADGGYTIDDENLFAPDVAYISRTRQQTLPYDGFGPLPPDLAVEVISPSDLKDPKRRIEDKLAAYRAAGVPMIWIVYPERREVEVHRAGQPMVIVTLDGTLDGADVLPGLVIAVRDIFEI